MYSRNPGAGGNRGSRERGPPLGAGRTRSMHSVHVAGSHPRSLGVLARGRGSHQREGDLRGVEQRQAVRQPALEAARKDVVGLGQGRRGLHCGRGKFRKARDNRAAAGSAREVAVGQPEHDRVEPPRPAAHHADECGVSPQARDARGGGSIPPWIHNSLLDDPNVIMKKFKRAVTDSKTEIKYDENRKGLHNLINIYSAYTGKTPDQIEDMYEGKMYSDFKVDLADIVIDALRPIQEEYNKIYNDKGYLDQLLKEGAEKARYQARKTLDKVYRKVGFIKRAR